MAFSVRRAIAIASAVLIWLAALLQILQVTGATGTDVVPPPMYNGTALEQAAERAAWKQHMEYENSQLALNIAIGAFFSFGTFGLAYCVLCLKKIFKKYQGGKSDLPDLMLICFLFGSLMLAYEFIADLGSEIIIVLSSNQALNSIDDSLEPQKFQNIAQTIEISSAVNDGRKIFIFGLLFVLLSVGVLLSSLMSLRTNILNVHHARLGIVTAVAGFLCFIFQIVLLTSMVYTTATFAHAAPFAVFMVIFGLILMPIWTVWLGFELARIKEDVIFRVETNNLVQNQNQDGNI